MSLEKPGTPGYREFFVAGDWKPLTDHSVLGEQLLGLVSDTFSFDALGVVSPGLSVRPVADLPDFFAWAAESRITEVAGK